MRDEDPCHALSSFGIRLSSISKTQLRFPPFMNQYHPYSPKYTENMLNFKAPTNHEPKCMVTHGTMGHVDRQQPPTKRKPFAAILSHTFIHKVRCLIEAPQN